MHEDSIQRDLERAGEVENYEQTFRGTEVSALRFAKDRIAGVTRSNAATYSRGGRRVADFLVNGPKAALFFSLNLLGFTETEPLLPPNRP